MRTRTYGFLLLAAIGMAPLGAFGVIAMDRARETAVAEVRRGNDRLARSVAERISAYMEREQELLESIGTAALLERDPGDAQALVDAYELRYRHLNDLEVYDAGGIEQVGRKAQYGALAARALRDGPVMTNVTAARDQAAAGFAHTMDLAVPVRIAGRIEGAVAGRLDLVGVWPPVHDVRVGSTGFVRLLAPDGELLAHGNPEERRWVFGADPAIDAAIVSAALLAGIAPNQQDEGVVPSVAFVRGTGWLVLVEQNVSEAFAAARAMQRDLAFIAAAVLALVVLLGLLFGRTIVRGLEHLRAHTRVLARGDLAARADPRTRLVEVRALGHALDEMAGSLDELQAQARARERLTTFGRVAAGLAHDLRQPLEKLRGAYYELMADPDDPLNRSHFEKIGRDELPELERYIQDLQRLAHTGDLGLEIELLDPALVAEDVADALGRNPRWPGVEFVAEGQAAPLHADYRLFRRAIANLAGNAGDACAKKHAGPGGRVRIQVVDGDGGVAVNVIDNGLGIEPERLTDLLSGDFQTTKRTSGIGLGLGVVRQVAAAHRGTLEVSSDLGQGSTFTLTIPRSSSTRERGDDSAEVAATHSERTQTDGTDEATDARRGADGAGREVAG
jgi:signal transduction histidine kinase